MNFSILAFTEITRTSAVELKGLRFLINVLSGDFMDNKPQDDSTNDGDITVTSKASNPYLLNGHTIYTFLDFITYQDERQCWPHEYFDAFVNAAEARGNSGSGKTDGKKAPIKVRCLPDRGNGSLQIIQSLKEVVILLAPHGNNTKKTDPGNCALVLFYTKTCPISASVAPHYNAVSKLFPDIQMGAIDSFRFHGLNTDFGIVGVPTIMLFHQGRVPFNCFL